MDLELKCKSISNVAYANRNKIEVSLDDVDLDDSDIFDLMDANSISISQLIDHYGFDEILREIMHHDLDEVLHQVEKWHAL